jgi:hypothetical protein
MKRIVLLLAAMTLAATTAMAYVQPGQLPQSRPQGGSTFIPGDGNDRSPLPEPITTDPIRGLGHPVPGAGGATNPVPEPGTMMLASMGLIALGAAVRRRRH